jgi:hypothetical protein
VVGIASLQHWLLSPATTSNLPNHGTATARDNLLSTRGELDPENAIPWVPGEDSSYNQVTLKFTESTTTYQQNKRKTGCSQQANYW